MICMLLGNKDYFIVIVIVIVIVNQMIPLEQPAVKLIKCENYLLRKRMEKCRLQNGGHLNCTIHFVKSNSYLNI